jgi:hypothetical protein
MIAFVGRPENVGHLFMTSTQEGWTQMWTGLGEGEGLFVVVDVHKGYGVGRKICRKPTKHGEVAVLAKTRYFLT